MTIKGEENFKVNMLAPCIFVSSKIVLSNHVMEEMMLYHNVEKVPREKIYTDNFEALSKEQIISFNKMISKIFISQDSFKYIREIVSTVRTHKEISRGPYPRVTSHLIVASSLFALLDQKCCVSTYHIKSIVLSVITNYNVFFKHQKVNPQLLLQQIVFSVQPPL